VLVLVLVLIFVLVVIIYKAWVWSQEDVFTPQYLKDEMDGIAEGICTSLGSEAKPDCFDSWALEIRQLNMLPELIRMACTAYGAWGKATPEGTGLIQLRALDFGSGPWANYTVIATHRGDPSNPGNAFTTVSFPGFVGLVTGVSNSGVGVSEKVWMNYNKYSLQPGSYQGEADVFVLRDILEKAKSKVDAEAIIQASNRTWGMWVGIGDYATQTFDLVAYRQKDAVVYTDVTAPAQTGQPYLENVCYVDKHPQPSGKLTVA
jgi:hypothetical protein